MAQDEKQRDSCIFYRSFYEAIKELPIALQGEAYAAIMEYALNGKEVELSGIVKTVFVLIKPQLVANKKRYENSKKGGRPSKNADISAENSVDNAENEQKTENQTETKSEKIETEIKPKENQTETKTENFETKPKPNVNVNDNVNNSTNYNQDILLKDIKRACAREKSQRELKELAQKFVDNSLNVGWYRERLPYEDMGELFEKYIIALTCVWSEKDLDDLCKLDEVQFAKIFNGLYEQYCSQPDKDVTEYLRAYVWKAIHNYVKEGNAQ